MLLLIQQDDLVLLIFASLDFPTLARIKRVCKHWRQIVDRVIPTILGNKPFTFKFDLNNTIRHYYYSTN